MLSEFYDKKLALVWTSIGAIKAICESEGYTDQEKIERIQNEIEILKNNNQQIKINNQNENIRTNCQ